MGSAINGMHCFISCDGGDVEETARILMNEILERTVRLHIMSKKKLLWCRSVVSLMGPGV